MLESKSSCLIPVLSKAKSSPTWVVVQWCECSILNQRFRVRALGMKEILLGASPLMDPAVRDSDLVAAPIQALETG